QPRPRPGLREARHRGSIQRRGPARLRRSAAPRTRCGLNPSPNARTPARPARSRAGVLGVTMFSVSDAASSGKLNRQQRRAMLRRLRKLRQRAVKCSWCRTEPLCHVQTRQAAGGTYVAWFECEGCETQPGESLTFAAWEDGSAALARPGPVGFATDVLTAPS